MIRMVKKKLPREVTNEKIMEVLLDMGKKVEAVESLMEVQVRRSSRLDNEMSRVSSKITRFETLVEKTVAEFSERLDHVEGGIKNLATWAVTKSDLADSVKDCATKNDLDRLREETFEPIAKAVDVDAKTLYDHGKRITVLERKAGLLTK